MSIKYYFKCILKNLPSEDEEDLLNFALQYNSSGTEENISFEQEDSRGRVNVQDHPFKLVTVYFDEIPSSEFIEIIERRWPNVDVQIEKCEQQDWQQNWKMNLKPFCLVHPFWVVPSWMKLDCSEEQIPIYIDPGMAFGTGTHETTQIAAQLLFDLLNKHPEIHDLTLFDVGTGTGILAILADKLNVKLVHANEIDFDAKMVAKENIELNKTRGVKIIDERVDQIQQPYDIVVANIIDGILLDLKKDLIRLSLKSLILTGIIIERENEFVKKFEKNFSYKMKKRIQKGDWVGYLYHI